MERMHTWANEVRLQVSEDKVIKKVNSTRLHVSLRYLLAELNSSSGTFAR